jgi:hypothetical protein
MSKFDAARDEYDAIGRDDDTLPCDSCDREVPYTEIIECSHCDARVCSKCLVEHAKGHHEA